jgi:hypothetical protein
MLELRRFFVNKENEGDYVLTSDFPFLLLCGLFLLSFGFFRHYFSLKLDFVDFLFKFMPVTKPAHTRIQCAFVRTVRILLLG